MYRYCLSSCTYDCPTLDDIVDDRESTKTTSLISLKALQSQNSRIQLITLMHTIQAFSVKAQ